MSTLLALILTLLATIGGPTMGGLHRRCCCGGGSAFCNGATTSACNRAIHPVTGVMGAGYLARSGESWVAPVAPARFLVSGEMRRTNSSDDITFIVPSQEIQVPAVVGSGGEGVTIFDGAAASGTATFHTSGQTFTWFLGVEAWAHWHDYGACAQGGLQRRCAGLRIDSTGNLARLHVSRAEDGTEYVAASLGGTGASALVVSTCTAPPPGSSGAVAISHRGLGVSFTGQRTPASGPRYEGQIDVTPLDAWCVCAAGAPLAALPIAPLGFPSPIETIALAAGGARGGCGCNH